MLFRVSLSMLGNTADAEDAVSETLLTLIRKNISFKDEEHKKAYAIGTGLFGLSKESVELLSKEAEWKVMMQVRLYLPMLLS